MKIQRYSDFVLENNKSLEFSKDLSIFENEYLKLKSEGLTEEQINENIFTSLFSSLGGGFSDVIKGYVIDWAAKKLGVDPYDNEGEMTFFYQLIRNVIEDVHFTEIGKYFGKGSCKNWSAAIVRGLIETLEERGVDYLLPKLGLKIEMNTGLGGTISSTFREALTNAVNNTAFVQKIEKAISSKICGFNIGDILSNKEVTSTDKQKIEKEIEKAETKDPDIYTKVMKTGLSGLLPNI